MEVSGGLFVLGPRPKLSRGFEARAEPVRPRVGGDVAFMSLKAGHRPAMLLETMPSCR